MASSNIARLGVVLGLDTAEFTAEIDKAIAANQKMARDIKRDTNAAAAEIASLKYATEDYGKTLTKVQLIEREINSGRFMNATKEMKDRLRESAAAYDAVASSAKKTTFQMSEQQKMQLGFQMTDFVTQIASGQNAMIAFIQQGGQLKDSMGGVGNAFRAILSVLSPVRIAIGGAVAAVGALAFAFYEADKEADSFNDSLTLTGRYAGITYEQFKNLSKQLAGETNTSISTVKEAMQAVVSSGQFTSASLLSVTNAISTYAKVAGVSGKEAADKLMSGFDGTAAGAKRLNDQFNFLTLAQYKQIEALEATGKKQEAAQIVALAFNKSIEAHRREVGKLEQTWYDVTKAMQDYWNKTKELMSGPTQSETLAAIDKQIDEIKAKLKGKENEDTIFTRGWTKTLKSLEASKEQILEIQRLQSRSQSGVGGEKGEIGEYTTYKTERRSALRDAQKAEREAKFRAAYADANELERIEIELQKKKDEALFEEAQKNQDTFGRVAVEAARKRAADIAIAEAEAKQKRKEYQWKKDVDEFDKETDILHRLMQERADIFKSIEEKKLNEDMTRQELSAKFSLLGATEKEIQLLKAKLEVQKEIEKLKLDNKFLNMSKEDQQKAVAALEAVGRAKAANIELADSYKKISEVSSIVWNNMSSMLDNFVKTGKLAFSDFAKSVIQELMAIQVKMATVRFLNSAFSAMGFGFQLPGFRAEGGPVSANSPYIVGERGPELFVPSGSGTIVPNNLLASAGNAGPTIVYNGPYINSMSAIDTQSATQFLARNKQAVYAANTSAARSLPSSR